MPEQPEAVARARMRRVQNSTLGAFDFAQEAWMVMNSVVCAPRGAGISATVLCTRGKGRKPIRREPCPACGLLVWMGSVEHESHVKSKQCVTVQRANALTEAGYAHVNAHTDAFRKMGVEVLRGDTGWKVSKPHETHRQRWVPSWAAELFDLLGEFRAVKFAQWHIPKTGPTEVTFALLALGRLDPEKAITQAEEMTEAHKEGVYHCSMNPTGRLLP